MPRVCDRWVVEFPVEDDPTKLHALAGMTGFVGTVWRVECMACGYRSSPYLRATVGRSQAIRHANSASHLRTARPSPRTPQDCEDGPGHEWSPAGGGLLLCINCETEKWAQDDGPGGEFLEDYEVPDV